MTQGDERANVTVIYRVHHATPTLPKTKTVYFFFFLFLGEFGGFLAYDVLKSWFVVNPILIGQVACGGGN